MFTTAARTRQGSDWWRNAVIYQVYVRSFQDSDGDGVGDLDGVRARLPYLRSLGVDGIWLNPFYPSPQRDHGYDVADYFGVHPEYGTLESFDLLIRDAHRLDLKVMVDVVPNHCSVEHPWFTAALAAGPGSPERARFHFAEGKDRHGAEGKDRHGAEGKDRHGAEGKNRHGAEGKNGHGAEGGGAEPPNNWRSIFGGPAWQRTEDGQWYLHTFAPEQADFNWRHPDVATYFEDVLRFWLDRGVDGLRIDVAHGLHKAAGLPDHDLAMDDELTGDPLNPFAWNQPEVHDVWRHWRQIAEEYTALTGRERALIGEVGLLDSRQLALYQRPDELHQSFYFEFLRAHFDDRTLYDVVDRGLDTIAGTASSVAWVLNNHDMPRSVTRYGGGAPGIDMGDVDLGTSRARAGALLMLALPGSAYVYQGEELGLPEVTDLPDDVLTDPMFHRTGGVRRGRDGCRVPMPWAADQAGFGFTSAAPWLPQPDWFADHAADRQVGSGESMLHLYRAALELRRRLPALASGEFRWLPTEPGVLAFTRGDGFCCVVNCSSRVVAAPVSGELLLASHHESGDKLPPNSAAWYQSAAVAESTGMAA